MDTREEYLIRFDEFRKQLKKYIKINNIPVNIEIATAISGVYYIEMRYSITNDEDYFIKYI